MYINMTPDKTNKTLHASQDDTIRQFKFKLVNDSQVLDTSDSIPPVIYDVEPNGIEQLLPINSSTPTTSPIIADIQYPDELRENQEFFERITPTTIKGKAKIKKIKGNTIVWNQLAQNGNLVNTGGWGQGGSRTTLTVANNIGTATLVNSLSTTYQNYRPVQLVQGHKILIHYEFKLPRTTAYVYACENNNTANNYRFGEMTNVSANTWHTVNAIHTVQLGGEESIAICYFATNRDGYQLGDQYQIRNLMVIDLTQMFGAGNEPTSVSDFTNLFTLPYYDYNTGSLLSFNGTGLKTIGFNQWDEEWESGIYNAITGVKQSGTRVRSKNFIKVLPNTPYYITIACNRYYYDDNFNYIGNKSVFTENTPDTTPPNCAYMTFNTFDAYGQIYKNDIAVSFESGTYEPYTENTIDLPISTYFSTGMKSAGTVYDELTESKAISRLGRIVFNGTQTLSYQDLGSYRVSYEIPDMEIGPTGATDIDTNVISNYLPSVSNNDTYSKKPGIHRRINGSRQIIIGLGESSGANTIELFNAYLQAHPLTVYYPLATPTEEDVETCSLVSEDIEKPLEYDNGFLVCDSDGLTTKSGFIPCKVKKIKGDETLYSQLINLHVERKP